MWFMLVNRLTSWLDMVENTAFKPSLEVTQQRTVLRTKTLQGLCATPFNGLYIYLYFRLKLVTDL